MVTCPQVQNLQILCFVLFVFYPVFTAAVGGRDGLYWVYFAMPDPKSSVDSQAEDRGYFIPILII